jgi:hypothetical protein
MQGIQTFHHTCTDFKSNLAVELQPYGSKHLDGYRRAVVPPIQKT